MPPRPPASQDACLEASVDHSVTDLLSPYVQVAPFDDLKFIQTKLEDLTRAERIKEARMNDAGEAMDEIEDVIGFIDPSEPDVIQNLRRAIRACAAGHARDRTSECVECEGVHA